MTGSAARAWAEALFDVATARGEQMRIREELEQLVEISREVPLLLRSLDSPVLRPEQKMGLLEEAFGSGLSERTVNLMVLLGRRMLARGLPDVSRIYAHITDECCGIPTAVVTTAVEIPARIEGALRLALEARLGRGVRLDMQVDPEIVGGMLVTTGGRRIDATVRGGLERIRRSLLESRPEGGGIAEA